MMRTKKFFLTCLAALCALFCALALLSALPAQPHVKAAAQGETQVTNIQYVPNFTSLERNLPMDLTFLVEFDAPAFDTFPNTGVWLAHSSHEVADSIWINGVPLLVNSNWEDTYIEVNRVWQDTSRYPVEYDASKVFYFVGINTTSKIYKNIDPNNGTTFTNYFNLKFDGTDYLTIKSSLPMSADGSYSLSRDYTWQITRGGDGTITYTEVTPQEITLTDALFIDNFKGGSIGTVNADFAVVLEFDAPQFVSTSTDSDRLWAWLAHNNVANVINNIQINGVSIPANASFEADTMEVTRCWNRYGDDVSVGKGKAYNSQGEVQALNTEKLYYGIAFDPTAAYNGATYADYFNLKFDGTDVLTVRKDLPVSRGDLVLDKTYDFRIDVSAQEDQTRLLSFVPFDRTNASLTNIYFVEGYQAPEHQLYPDGGQSYDFAFILEFDALRFDEGTSGAWLAQNNANILDKILINGVPLKGDLNIPNVVTGDPGDNYIEVQRSRNDMIERLSGYNIVDSEGNEGTISENKVWYLVAFNTTNPISTNTAKLDFPGQTHAQRFNLRFDGTDMLTIKRDIPLSSDGSTTLTEDLYFSFSREGGTGGVLSFAPLEKEASLSKVFTVDNYVAADQMLYPGIIYDFALAFEFDAPCFDVGTSGAWLAQNGGPNVTENILINGVPLQSDLDLYNYVTGDLGDNYVEVQRSRNDMLSRLAQADFYDANGNAGSLNQGKVWFFLAFDTTRAISTNADKLDFPGQTHAQRYNLRFDGTDTITIKAGLPISADGSYTIDRDYTFYFLPYTTEGDGRSFVEIEDDETIVSVSGLPDLSSAFEVSVGDAHNLPSTVQLVRANGETVDISLTYTWATAPEVGYGVENEIIWPDLSAYTLQPGLPLPEKAVFDVYPAPAANAEFVSAELTLSNDKRLVNIELRFGNQATMESGSAGDESGLSARVRAIIINGYTLEDIAALLAENNAKWSAQQVAGQIPYEVSLPGFSVEWQTYESGGQTLRSLVIVLPSQMTGLLGVGIKGDGSDLLNIPAGDSFTLPEGGYFASEVSAPLNAVGDLSGSIDAFFADDQLQATGAGWDGNDAIVLFFRTDLPGITQAAGLRNEQYRDNILINGHSITELSQYRFVETNFCIESWLKDEGLSGSGNEGMENRFYFYVTIHRDSWLPGSNGEQSPLLRFDGTDSITVLKEFSGLLGYGLTQNYVWQIKGLEAGEGDLQTWGGMEALDGDDWVADVLTAPGSGYVPDVRVGAEETLTGTITVLTVLGETAEGSFTGRATEPDKIGISSLEIVSFDLGRVNFFEEYDFGELWVSVVDYITEIAVPDLPDTGKVGETMELPQTVTVTFYSGETIVLGIDWNCTTPETAGELALVGTIAADGYLLADGVSAEIRHTISVEGDTPTEPVEENPSGCNSSIHEAAGVVMAIVLLAACGLVIGRKRKTN